MASGRAGGSQRWLRRRSGRVWRGGCAPGASGRPRACPCRRSPAGVVAPPHTATSRSVCRGAKHQQPAAERTAEVVSSQGTRTHAGQRYLPSHAPQPPARLPGSTAHLARRTAARALGAKLLRVCGVSWGLCLTASGSTHSVRRHCWWPWLKVSATTAVPQNGCGRRSRAAATGSLTDRSSAR